jgi:hypothetical protein
VQRTYKQERWCTDGAVKEEWAIGSYFNFPAAAATAAPSQPARTRPGGRTRPALRALATATSREQFFAGGKVLESWTKGDDWNNPEANCCACGKLQACDQRESTAIHSRSK